jgi:phage-related tail protein
LNIIKEKTMAENNEHLLILGEIKGQLSQVIENQKTNDEKISRRFDAIDERFDGFDSRLRTVEQKSAVTGAFAGGIVSIAIALAIEKLKTMVGMR